jgi:opacity protein-like surface antigen
MFLAGPAMAQGKVEVGALIGWTLSDGVTGFPYRAPDGNTYDAVDLKDSMSWGLMVGVLANDYFEAGFMFNQQMSALRLEGTKSRDLGDMAINSYHGYGAATFGDPKSKIRPYILGGLGATSYGSVSYTNAAGMAASIGSATRFSTTWGAGVKFYASPRLGLRLGVRWTPTWKKSEPGGWWCDPYWGCYTASHANYANQIDVSAGVTIRF